MPLWKFRLTVWAANSNNLALLTQATQVVCKPMLSWRQQVWMRAVIQMCHLQTTWIQTTHRMLAWALRDTIRTSIGSVMPHRHIRTITSVRSIRTQYSMWARKTSTQSQVIWTKSMHSQTVTMVWNQACRLTIICWVIARLPTNNSITGSMASGTWTKTSTARPISTKMSKNRRESQDQHRQQKVAQGETGRREPMRDRCGNRIARKASDRYHLKSQRWRKTLWISNTQWSTELQESMTPSPRSTKNMIIVVAAWMHSNSEQHWQV